MVRLGGTAGFERPAARRRQFSVGSLGGGLVPRADFFFLGARTPPSGIGSLS